MSTNPNENNVAKVTEIKPASESGLMRKTKSELVQIILRRDSEFIEDKNAINQLKEEKDVKADEISALNAKIKELKEEKTNILKKAGEASAEITKKDNIIKNKQQEINDKIDDLNNLKKEMNDTIKHTEEVERCYNTSKVFNIILAATTVVAIGIIIFFI